MANVCVITGGSSGIGLAAAKFIPKEKIIVLSGRRQEKLDDAVAELKELGYTVYAKTCNVLKRESVKELAEFACTLGTVKNVIHTVGISPDVKTTSEIILRVNALGTVYVNQEFSKVMKEGSVILNVGSHAAYAVSSFTVISDKTYKLAETDETTFLQKLLKKSESFKEEYQRKSFAYGLSKNFVIWYAQKCAFEYGLNGIRVLSVSPGFVTTDMGSWEKDDRDGLIPFTAEERMGKAEELGYALATLSDERNGYLAGVDVLCDGGCANGKKDFKKKKK